MSRTENVRNWKEFKLTITDPPSYKEGEHFELIQKHLIPFIEKIEVQFWITNYFDPSGDYILFRVEVNEKERKLTENFLEGLVNQKEILRWDPPRDWNPKEDAKTRIISASQKLGLPTPDIALKVQQVPKPCMVAQRVPLEERAKQLELIFTESVGPCTRALYKSLKSRPTDPWMMSLFIHLVLNSLDIWGPTPPCEESIIRSMPVY